MSYDGGSSLSICDTSTSTTPSTYGLIISGSASSTGTGGVAGDLQGLATVPLTGTKSGSGSSSACCEDMATLDTFVIRLTDILKNLNKAGDLKNTKDRFDVMTETIQNIFNKIP